MSESLSLSLRERKRAETWSTIHLAAAGLTLEKGLAYVTVEAIAEQANVSSRTFFNYFSTKEDAILGLQEPKIGDQARADFAQAENFVDGVAALLLAVSQTTFGGDYATSRRFEVLAQYPELLQRRISYISKVETLVAGLVRQRLEQSGTWSEDLADLPTSDIAQVLVMIGSATMRFAMQKDVPLTRAGQFDVLNDAIDVFQRILRKVV